MTSMSYVFIKLMGSVLFEAFLLGVKKISLKKRLIFSSQEYLVKRKFVMDNFFESTIKEP